MVEKWKTGLGEVPITTPVWASVASRAEHRVVVRSIRCTNKSADEYQTNVVSLFIKGELQMLTPRSQGGVCNARPLFEAELVMALSSAPGRYAMSSIPFDDKQPSPAMKIRHIIGTPMPIETVVVFTPTL